jgi:hypothetical protein
MGLLNKVILEFPATHINSGPFAEGTRWINRLPEASGDNGYWQEFFNLRKALNVPVLVAFQAGLPAVTAENTMNDAAMVDSVSFKLLFGGTKTFQRMELHMGRLYSECLMISNFKYCQSV